MAFIFLLLFPATLTLAQEPLPDFAPTMPFDSLPRLFFHKGNFDLTRLIAPDPAAVTEDNPADLDLIAKRTAGLMTLWDSLQTEILTSLSRLSGIDWAEPTISIYLVRFLPRPILAEPPTLAVEGIKDRNSIIAAPSGAGQLFLLLQVLAARNLLQAEFADSNHWLRQHPLYRRGLYRFDLLALILARACARDFIPPDSLRAVVRSEWWQRYNPAGNIFEKQFAGEWRLSPEKPLLWYLSRKSSDSLLARVIPLTPKPDTLAQKPVSSESTSGSPGGRFGITVTRGRDGYLRVTAIDSTKLAYALGLRQSDRIKAINGAAVNSARELTEKLIDALAQNIFTLAVIRAGKTEELYIQNPSR